MLFTGIGWEDLPQELGFGSGMTCWRRLRDWQDAGVFAKMHQEMLARSHAPGLIDFDRVMVDGSHIRAKKRGAATGPSPDDRAKTGSKHHILTSANGFPLAVTLSPRPTSTTTYCCPNSSTASDPCADAPARRATESRP